MTNPVKRQLVHDWMTRNKTDIVCYKKRLCNLWQFQLERQFPRHSIFHSYIYTAAINQSCLLSESALLSWDGLTFCITYDIAIHSHAIINGRLTRCICSAALPLLYVLSAEPLAAAIRSDPLIRGIPSPHDTVIDILEYILLCWWHDLLCLNFSKLSTSRRGEKIYQAASGAIFNRHKSTGLWLHGLLDKQTSGYSSRHSIDLSSGKRHRIAFQPLVIRSGTVYNFFGMTCYRNY